MSFVVLVSSKSIIRDWPKQWLLWKIWCHALTVKQFNSQKMKKCMLVNSDFSFVKIDLKKSMCAFQYVCVCVLVHFHHPLCCASEPLTSTCMKSKKDFFLEHCWQTWIDVSRLFVVHLYSSKEHAKFMEHGKTFDGNRPDKVTGNGNKLELPLWEKELVFYFVFIIDVEHWLFLFLLTHGTLATQTDMGKLFWTAYVLKIFKRQKIEWNRYISYCHHCCW